MLDIPYLQQQQQQFTFKNQIDKVSPEMLMNKICSQARCSIKERTQDVIGEERQVENQV